jgi:hypothetical protein
MNDRKILFVEQNPSAVGLKQTVEIGCLFPLIFNLLIDIGIYTVTPNGSLSVPAISSPEVTKDILWDGIPAWYARTLH